MFLAKVDCPIPTPARKHTATVTEWFSPANQELHARRHVCALLEDCSMKYLNHQRGLSTTMLILHNDMMSTGGQ